MENYGALFAGLVHLLFLDHRESKNAPLLEKWQLQLLKHLHTLSTVYLSANPEHYAVDFQEDARTALHALWRRHRAIRGNITYMKRGVYICDVYAVCPDSIKHTLYIYIPNNPQMRKPNLHILYCAMAHQVEWDTQQALRLHMHFFLPRMDQAYVRNGRTKLWMCEVDYPVRYAFAVS